MIVFSFASSYFLSYVRWYHKWCNCKWCKNFAGTLWLRAFNVVRFLLYHKTFFFWRPFFVFVRKIAWNDWLLSLFRITTCYQVFHTFFWKEVLLSFPFVLLSDFVGSCFCCQDKINKWTLFWGLLPTWYVFNPLLIGMPQNLWNTWNLIISRQNYFCNSIISDNK